MELAREAQICNSPFPANEVVTKREDRSSIMDHSLRRKGTTGGVVLNAMCYKVLFVHEGMGTRVEPN